MSIVSLALYYLLEIMSLVIFVRCVISWLPLGNNRFIEFIYTITEPVLAPVRNLINKYSSSSSMYVDFSPVVVFLIITLIQRLLF